jgi:LmbE family N-acetylglucosaminyl deacetylase
VKHQFNKKVVAIHAHPDDTEIFSAGTMALMKAKGWELAIVTMTPGGLGGIGSTEKDTIATRKKEAEKAADMLGAKYYCLDGRDGYLYDTEALRIATTEIIRKEKAGMVMTHLPFDYHSDHRTTCNIVETATMVATLPNVPCESAPLEITPLLYHTAPLGSSDPVGGKLINPHFYVDITSVMDTKMAMLGKHQSQIELMRVMHKMDDFFGEMRKQNAVFGELAGCEYAEAFWQHLGGGFQKDPVLQETIAEFFIEHRALIEGGEKVHA